MALPRQMDLRDHVIQSLHQKVADLEAFNTFLRFSISQIRQEGLTRSSPLAFRTETEMEYDRRIEVMGGYVTELEAALASTHRDKKKISAGQV